MGFMYRRTVYSAQHARWTCCASRRSRSSSACAWGCMGIARAHRRPGPRARRRDRSATGCAAWSASAPSRSCGGRCSRPRSATATAALPALWLSSRMHREKSTEPEVKGCLRHGYRSLIDAFERGAASSAASTIRMQHARRGDRARRRRGWRLRLADGAARASTVVSTSPLVQFQRMTAGLELDPRVADLHARLPGRGERRVPARASR